MRVVICKWVRWVWWRVGAAVADCDFAGTGKVEHIELPREKMVVLCEGTWMKFYFDGEDIW